MAKDVDEVKDLVPKIEEEFKPLSFFRELFLKEDELVDYYNRKRKYEFEKGVPLKGMRLRDKLHPILLKLIQLNRKLFTKQTITVLNDPRKKTDRPVIYAITHVGMYDFQIVCEAIKDHQYPFAGDPETMYRSMDGVILSLNGLVYCDTNDKEDRRIALERAKEVLKRGTNLAIYPEGVWNVSPNLLSLPLFPGIIKIAMETGCDIVPVAVEQYGDDFYVNIGENFKVSNNSEFATMEDEKRYIEEKKIELRDVFATLKWDILEVGPKLSRDSIGSYEEAYHDFVRTRLDEWKNPKTKQPYYSEELVKYRTFRPKGFSFFEDVFSHLRGIKLTKENAFLFKNISFLPKNIQDDMQKEIDNNMPLGEEVNIKLR